MATRVDEGFRTLNVDESIDGVPVAQLALGRADLGGRARMRWEQDSDDLGAYHAVALELPDAGSFALVSYDDAPTPSTTVIADPSGGLTERLNELFASLRVAPDDVIDRLDEAPESEVAAPTAAVIELRDDLERQLQAVRDATERIVQRTSALSALTSSDLTSRQREVAMYFARGLSSAEIADRLEVSTETVTRHLRHITEAMHQQATSASQPRRRGRRSSSLARSG